MGIISLNEKRTSTNPTHTTGKEKSYHTTDQFPSASAKITGKIYSWGNATASVFGGFGAFWENTDGTLVDLKMEIGDITPTNERAARIHTSASEDWLDLVIHLQGASNGRLVFYARKSTIGNNFQSDVGLDDIKLVSTSGTINNFDPSEASVRSASKWQRSTNSTSLTGYSDAKNDYDDVNFFDFTSIQSGSNAVGVNWNYTQGHGGTSTGTGSDNAADNNDNTVYLYWEATGSDTDGYGSFLRFKSNYNITTGLAI
tara:strand:- start:2854 stop:3624 length:771 start_codon:yes stop_codon:yes gene_type:complete